MTDRWKYPALAKPDSDGIYCYQIQRRISIQCSHRLAPYLSPNAATGLDLIFGVAAAGLVLLDHWLLGVLFIQVFGVFSCVDGEIARIQDRTSKMGDFLDTLTDRVFDLVGTRPAKSKNCLPDCGGCILTELKGRIGNPG